MIHINKPATPPQKLVVDGKRKRRSHSQSYTRNSDAYKLGEKSFNFDSNIYAHPTVKQALILAQHGKCCFCERLIGTDGDVEHFRPKQAYRQEVGQQLQRPGYYWLAYEWDNLYLSCTACNQRHKQNLFPLKDPALRATDHRQSINQEEPLFVNPGRENPEDFIGFRGEFAFPINSSQKGPTSINTFKLNDNSRGLPEVRLQQLKRLKQLQCIVALAASQPNNLELQNEAKDAQLLLQDAVLPQSEFAAAARWAISSNFQFVI
uniref:TIGR02646 family protein n=1 Tax=Cyanothece sp. (strain PCC 7425 / ATCC 29141) TaxID=395961 RepID=B8HNF4_CYAP4